MLWPILHYRLDLAEFTRRDLGGYFRVNEFFASNLEKLLRPDDVIWVHDYHLMPLAKALRERGHKNKIGFFIHIPFPPPEILTALPNHERLIPALGNYDLVGFQTEIDATNFSRYLANECGLEAHRRGQLRVRQAQAVRIGVFPVGVETEAFARLARRAIESTFVRERAGQPVRPRHDHRRRPARLHQGHSGADERVRAFPDHISRNGTATSPICRSRRTAAPHIPEYADIGRLVGEAVGRINGKFGEASWTPVRYINKAHSRTALAGLYRAARAALVTPLRDGMNLVAKEFVAAQNAGRSGRADPVALCRRRARMHRRAAGQSLRSRRRRDRHQPRAVDVAGGAAAAPCGELQGAVAATISAIGRSASCKRSNIRLPPRRSRFRSAPRPAVEPILT